MLPTNEVTEQFLKCYGACCISQVLVKNIVIMTFTDIYLSEEDFQTMNHQKFIIIGSTQRYIYGIFIFGYSILTYTLTKTRNFP